MRYFHHYSDSPLLIVNSERLNFVDSNEHLDLLDRAHEGDARRTGILQPRLMLQCSENLG